MADLSVKLDKGSAQRVTDLISRIQRDMGIDLPNAIRFGAWFIAKSLSASTPASKKKRKLRTNKNDDRRFPKAEYPKFVHVYQHNGKRRRVYLKDEQTGNSPWRIIRRSGLAKSSWMWMVGALGRPAKSPHPKMPGVTSVVQRGGKINPEITLTNRLEYIETALRFGPKPVSYAVERAGRAFGHFMEKRLAKAVNR